MCITNDKDDKRTDERPNWDEFNDYKPEAGDRLSEHGINSSSTIHPNLLLRTPVFTPTSRNKIRSGRIADLGGARELLIGDMEGYEKVRIAGLALSVETDFKVWCGIVRTIQESGYKDKGSIRMSFIEFAKLCGFQTKRIDAPLRERLRVSMGRIMSQVVEFSKNDSQSVKMVHLVEEIKFDTQKDWVDITPSKSVWGLYKMDYTTFLRQKVFNALSKSELAICLFMYIQSMPANPKRRSMTRIRERMRLAGDNGGQNRSIIKGLEKLKAVGYLRYHLVKGKDDTYIYIDERDQNLGLNAIKSKIEEQQNDDDIIEGELREIENELKTEDGNDY